MRVLAAVLLCLLIAASPADVPTGRFQQWMSSDKGAHAFTSGGVAVRVAPLPCPAQPVGDSSCRWDGYNNQGAVTVSAPGAAPITVRTDASGSYARIAVATLRAGDPRPGVLIESQSGGSGGDLTLQVLVPTRDGYRVASSEAAGIRLQGRLDDAPRDLSGDGRIDLVFTDPAFDSVFGCNACTPRPPLIVTVSDGRLVDESRDPALRPVFRADMARWQPICLSTSSERNGACAAYVADAARAGLLPAAWAAMRKHYEHDGGPWEWCDLPASAWKDRRCPAGHAARYTSFPAALRAFLKRAGYLTG